MCSVSAMNVSIPKEATFQVNACFVGLPVTRLLVLDFTGYRVYQDLDHMFRLRWRYTSSSVESYVAS